MGDVSCGCGGVLWSGSGAVWSGGVFFRFSSCWSVSG